jgi:hypothetical protein
VATLSIGSKTKYHTIQSAVNAVHDGDTIKVAYGTYKETVQNKKSLTILGTNYPKVDRFYFQEVMAEVQSTVSQYKKTVPLQKYLLEIL